MLMAGDVQWGDVPTWAGVGVGLIALIGAIIGAVQAFRVLGIERQRDVLSSQEAAERAGEVRRLQATGVSGWVGEVLTPTSHPTFVVSLRNASELPVYDVVSIVSVGSANASISIGVLPPAAVPLERSVSLLLPAGASVTEVSLSLSFRDSAGARWLRSGSGLLSEDGVVQQRVAGALQI